MIEGLTRKAEWIFNQFPKGHNNCVKIDDLEYCLDDIIDALLENITQPRSFIDAVETCADRYDREITRFTLPGEVSPTKTSTGRFSHFY